MLHWTHVPEAPDRTLEEQMWRIIAGPQSEPRKIRQRGLRAGLIVAAACVPMAGSVAWGAAYILGLAR